MQLDNLRQWARRRGLAVLVDRQEAVCLRAGELFAVGPSLSDAVRHLSVLLGRPGIGGAPKGNTNARRENVERKAAQRREDIRRAKGAP